MILINDEWVATSFYILLYLNQNNMSNVHEHDRRKFVISIVLHAVENIYIYVQ